MLCVIYFINLIWTCKYLSGTTLSKALCILTRKSGVCLTACFKHNLHRQEAVVIILSNLNSNVRTSYFNLNLLALEVWIHPWIDPRLNGLICTINHYKLKVGKKSQLASCNEEGVRRTLSYEEHKYFPLRWYQY